MRVLIVEDVVFMAEAVQSGLRQEAIAADVVLDGADAVHQVALYDYDVVILDRDLPGLHGDDVCRHIVLHHPHTRVLMLTAAGRVDDLVRGLEIGADDYLAKPFQFPELVARVRALSRRSTAAKPPVLEQNGVRLDSFRREVYRDGRYVRLSRKEFAVLEVLLRADGGVVSAETLLEKAWDENADPFTNAIRVTVSTLRKKLGPPWIISTVPGVGYQIAGP
ncbi:response regulator transcription factor [Aeromicrobium sp. P5_D10]